MQTRKMDEKKVEGALKGMEKCLAEIETVWLANGEKQFLAGDSISVRRQRVEILCRFWFDLQTFFMLIIK